MKYFIPPQKQCRIAAAIVAGAELRNAGTGDRGSVCSVDSKCNSNRYRIKRVTVRVTEIYCP
jgi:hypothetical protein